MTTRKRDRRVAQEPHYLRLEKLTADLRVNDRRGPVDAIREKLAQQLQEQRDLTAELVSALQGALPIIDAYRKVSGGDGDLAAMNARVILSKVKQ